MSLPSKLRREVALAAKQQHVSASEYIRDAVKQKLWLDAFDEARRALVPKALSVGIYTDEDVFNVVS